MSSFVGLLIREWHEHRGAFLWVPIVWLGLVMLAGISAVMLNHNADVTFEAQDEVEITEKLGEGAVEEQGFLEIVAAMALDVAGSTDAELENKMNTLLRGVAMPFHLVFLLIAFFALLSCLYDERKDHSILFWKSMPVGDLPTVASKLLFVIWVAPLVTIAAIVLAQFFVVTLSAVFVEDGMGARIWSASEIWLRPFGLLSRYFLLGLWALPFCGWLMLVSASANRLPLLWALGIPVVVNLLEQILFGTNFLSGVIVEYFKVLVASPAGTNPGWSGQLGLVGELTFWGGLIVALIFLAGAVLARRRFNEI